jgi:Amt family ammonium transporter
MEQLGPQLIGVALIGAVVFALSLGFWLVTKAVFSGIRVSEEEEIDGLDIGEHGNTAYPDFQGSSVFSSTHSPAPARASVPVPGIARNPT